MADKAAIFFLKLGLLHVKPQLAEFCFADIRDEKGECQFIKIINDIKNICFEVSNREFLNNNLLKEFGNHFDFKKILIYFEKALAERIQDTIIFINAAKWHSINKKYLAGDPVFFFHEKNLWSKYLSRYATGLNLKAVEYRSAINASFGYYLTKGKSFILSKIKSKLHVMKMQTNKNMKKETNFLTVNSSTNSRVPHVAAWYTGRTVTFDFKKRSDFFWLLKSDIPHQHVLIYFDRTDLPATGEMADILNKESIKFIAMSGKAKASDKIPVWHFSKIHKETKNYLTKVILKNFLSDIIKFKITPNFYITNIIYFIIQYSYWYDFFKFHQIKININPYDFSKLNVPMHLALQKNGGISISYQWSNLSFSSVSLSSCADVLFSFGPAYQLIWEKNRSNINNLIYCGYVTDYAFKEVRKDSIKLREQLQDKGVKFIICYFDENSSDDRMSIIPNKRSAEIYAYFIKKMLEDKTLGLIFKPGYPKTLYQRISTINALIEKARISGRCIFIDKGSYITENYPTEAAQAADICIGLLLSGTVALESYLSGTPTVFIDLEGLYSNPLYQQGRGKIVFDNLDELFSTIQKFRMNHESIRGFGDLSPWAKDRDPFKDGNASLRMGQYIGWLFEKFIQGEAREHAIQYANQKYAETWGAENVTKL